MASSIGNPSSHDSSQNSAEVVAQNGLPPSEDSTGINTEHMFRLIESILPFEACLYHQVLPLSVEGKYLSLGMVDPHDPIALSYVRQMIGYIHCALIPKPISSNLHQAMLSAYLNHADKKQHQRQTQSNQGMVSNSVSPSDPVFNVPDVAAIFEELVLDGEETQTTGLVTPYDQQIQVETVIETIDHEATMYDEATVSEIIAASPSSPPPPTVPAHMDSVPVLDIEAYYLASPIEVLAELPPGNLLQELLGRALIGGIGRLYFEHKGQYGRILWSQSGVLQSVLDKLTPDLFEHVIGELKSLAGLESSTITDLRQVELERLYENKRLLLRLRFIPGQYGEQATLQVLRGAALKFYEQQQINRLGKDALSIAHQLQRKLTEIRTHKSKDELPKHSLDSLVELNRVLNNLNQQMQDLED